MRAFAIALATAFACGHARPVPELSADELLARARAAHQVPATLTADAKAFVDAPQNGGRYALRIAVKRPASLRIEANTPLGDPAAILVAAQGRFALLDLRGGVFLRGPATPRNLSRLLPAPLTADELVALLTGSFPERSGATPFVDHTADGYRLTMVEGDERDEISFGSDLRVNGMRRTNRTGVAWVVRLDEHDDSSGAQVPRLLHLSVPSQKTEVDLRLRNIATGLPPPGGAFLLGVPKGMRVEDVE